MHTTKPDSVGTVKIIFDSEAAAREFARDRSTDFGVLSAAVTRFRVGELGSRHPVAWFVRGQQQPQHFDRQLYPTDGRR